MLLEPGDIPQVAVLEAVGAEGEGDDFVGENFLAALGLEDQAGSAHVHAVGIAQHHGSAVVAGDGADVDVDALGRKVAAAGMGQDGEFPGVHAGGDLDGFGDFDLKGILGFEGVHQGAGKNGQHVASEAGAAGKVEVFAQAGGAVAGAQTGVADERQGGKQSGGGHFPQDVVMEKFLFHDGAQRGVAGDVAQGLVGQAVKQVHGRPPG